ncbi:MAG: maleylacetate reductase [Qingshengfaniella sp.]
MRGFTHQANPARVVFGRGTMAQAGEELVRLGTSRALVLSTPQQAGQARALADALGPLAVGLFDGAAMHTPVDVTARAMAVYDQTGADSVVALGGGSTIGLGKAIAARSGAPQLVIATSYAGSEVTPILGETENGVKTTRKGPEILPETVIYDPDLTDGLPLPMTISSGLNAMAHAAEGVYAQDGSPIFTLIAVEGLGALKGALPRLVADPQDRDARDEALYGAWLCGTVLGGVGMSIHHKLCHTLGGALDLPHAETHAILLPHTIAYVETGAPEALAPVAALFGGQAGRGLHAFAQGLGAPMSLADLGVREDQLDALADQAVANPYWTPRPLDRPAIRALLGRALTGGVPE